MAGATAGVEVERVVDWEVAGGVAASPAAEAMVALREVAEEAPVAMAPTEAEAVVAEDSATRVGRVRQSGACIRRRFEESGTYEQGAHGMARCCADEVRIKLWLTVDLAVDMAAAEASAPVEGSAGLEVALVGLEVESELASNRRSARKSSTCPSPLPPRRRRG